jgi:hypothetical protein
MQPGEQFLCDGNSSTYEVLSIDSAQENSGKLVKNEIAGSVRQRQLVALVKMAFLHFDY